VTKSTRTGSNCHRKEQQGNSPNNKGGAEAVRGKCQAPSSNCERYVGTTKCPGTRDRLDRVAKAYSVGRL